MTLESLAVKYSSDKYYAHSYIPFYEKLFAGLDVRRLLEIGIGYEDLMTPFVPKYVHGSSLYMWSEFFPESEIFSADIREDTLINEGRIRSCVVDQSSVDSLVHMFLELGGRFDVMIDDGSHEPENQILTAKILIAAKSKSGGWAYVIEDCREPEHVSSAIRNAIHGIEVTVHQFDKRPDDCLVVIK